MQKISETTFYEPTIGKINGSGIAGLVLTLLVGIFYWVPILGLILWFFGYICLWIGAYKKPRVIAVIGLILSYIELILVVLVMTGLAKGLEMFVVSLGVFGGFLVVLVTMASILGFFVPFWIISIMRSLKNIEHMKKIEHYYMANGGNSASNAVPDGYIIEDDKSL
ncbi:MAG: hypothetical protein K2O46_00340 [Bacteroidales bacterium]|nr:hypothetical protein [Bacteroidales bacterium]